jgi:hypothetical protein
MKEDVLEQIVDDYLQMQGYFTTHNVRFNPPKDEHYVAKDDSVPSDIDVVGLHPKLTGPDRVMVVSCKSWQSGFAAPLILAQLRGKAKNPSAGLSCGSGSCGCRGGRLGSGSGSRRSPASAASPTA